MKTILEEIAEKCYYHLRTVSDTVTDIKAVITESIAESEAKQWKPYPENVPKVNKEYLITDCMDNIEMDNWLGDNWLNNYTEDVIAFREPPATYTEKGEDDGT